MAMITGPDEWAHVDTSHLDGDTEKKSRAVRMKQSLIRLQEDRVMVQNEIHIGSPLIQENYISTTARLNLFCEDVLKQLNDDRKIVFIETWGDSDRWDEERQRIDGESYYKNEESAGVVGICLKVRPLKRRDHQEPDLFAYLHVGKIIENEAGGRPILPEKLVSVVTHPKALFVGENVARHLMRLENSFFTTLNNVRYLGLSDLVERYERTKLDSWDRFFIDPFASHGILGNFHRVFTNETFFKNPFETVADWDTCATMRDQQLAYAFTNLWAMSAIFDEIIEHYESYRMQLSPMCTIFPRQSQHERRDDQHLRMRRGACPPPPWYQESVWPRGEMRGHPACIYGSGDPKEIRRLQKAEWEETYGSLPEERRRLKRRCLDGAIDDNQQVDEHRRDIEAEKKEKEEMRVFAKSIAHGLHSEMTDQDLAAAVKLGSGDEVWLLAGLMEAVTVKALLKRLLDFFGGRWPSDRKTKLVEALVADGYFKSRKEIGPLSVMNGLALARPHPRLFLLFNHTDEGPANYFATLTDSSRKEILVYLSRYLAAQTEDREVQLEACPFYRKDMKQRCVWVEKDVIALIERLCKAKGDTPSPSYFRKLRPQFVEKLIEHGENGRVTVENAIKQALAFAGDDWRDQADMVTALGKWNAVSAGVKNATGAFPHPPQFYHVDKNLAKAPDCREILHRGQTVDSVVIVDSAGILEEARREMTGDMSYVHIILNKNPRRLTETPSTVVFKAPGSRIYAVFPQEVDVALYKEVLMFLADADIATRTSKIVKSILRCHNLSARLLDVTAALLKVGAGRKNESIGEWLWGHRFCPITKEDWLSPPLSSLQERHLAYYMDFMEQAVLKIGLKNIPPAAR